jgi:hypothetical protein
MAQELTTYASPLLYAESIYRQHTFKGPVHPSILVRSDLSNSNGLLRIPPSRSLFRHR